MNRRKIPNFRKGHFQLSDAVLRLIKWGYMLGICKRRDETVEDFRKRAITKRRGCMS